MIERKSTERDSILQYCPRLFSNYPKLQRRKKKISFDKRLNRTIFHERRKRKARVFETRRELQLLATTFPFLSRDTSGYSKISMLEGKEGRRSDEASKREAALRGLKNGKYVWRRHASRGFIPRVHTSSRRRRA